MTTPENTLPGTIDQAAPLGPQLLRSLRSRIVRTELEPGARLSEQDVASAYALSRQPVREAFIRLGEEGLLEIRPQRGTFVRKISLEAVRDARFIREAIEADIVRLAAADGDPALVAELDALIARQQDVPEGDAPGFVPLDEAFHRTIAEGAGKARAWALVEVVKAQMDRVSYLAVSGFPKAEVVAQHRAIADAIARRAPDEAEAVMRRHLRKVLGDLPAIVSANPHFFEPDDREAADPAAVLVG